MNALRIIEAEESDRDDDIVWFQFAWECPGCGETNVHAEAKVYYFPRAPIDAEMVWNPPCRSCGAHIEDAELAGVLLEYEEARYDADREHAETRYA